MKSCPFCGGEGALFHGEHSPAYSTGLHRKYVKVKCKSCSASTAELSIDHLCDFTECSVLDFRTNPILMIKEEARYKEYLKLQNKIAVELWDCRI